MLPVFSELAPCEWGVSSPPVAHRIVEMDQSDFDRVEVADVSRHFGRRRAVTRVTLTVRRGDILGLLGPNGAGKSTLIGMLATLVTPTSGRITYGERPGLQSGPAIRRRIGLLAHELHLYPELSARQNLDFFARLYGLDFRTVVPAALEAAALTDRADDEVSAYSRGMRQRLALERSLLHQPRLGNPGRTLGEAELDRPDHADTLQPRELRELGGADSADQNRPAANPRDLLASQELARRARGPLHGHEDRRVDGLAGLVALHERRMKLLHRAVGRRRDLDRRSHRPCLVPAASCRDDGRHDGEGQQSNRNDESPAANADLAETAQVEISLPLERPRQPGFRPGRTVRPTSRPLDLRIDF